METINEGGKIECQTNNAQESRSGSPMSSFLRVFRRMADSLSVKLSSQLSNLSVILKKLWLEKVSIPLLRALRPRLERMKQWGVEMIGSMEKGIAAAQLTAPPQGSFDGVDLRVLPKYICFRAALLHNRLTLQYCILIVSAVFGAYFIISRVEVQSLYSRLRAKEYILAPGVQDFTPASAQSVPDSYVSDAVMEYLGQLGNISASNVEDQYRMLSESMSSQLKVKFLAEASDFKAKVKAENISELLSVTEKEIRSTGDGYYQATVLGRRDTYVNNEYIGHNDEAIEMVLQLVPPKSGRRWFLQINSLTRQSAETFRVKRKF